MKLYSDFAPRRTRQIVADVLAVIAIGGWVWLGVFVYRLIMNLSDFGVQMEQAGAGFKDTMSRVGDALAKVPVIGSGISGPFTDASRSGAALEAAGQSQQLAVAQLATGLGVGIAVLPVLTILLLWLIPRIRFARRASRAQSVVSTTTGIDLLALRALATQRISALDRIDPDAMAAWRRGDHQVMTKLAQLELKSLGVRMPDTR
jgi:hypothetical protein